jgi:hypothetical protein
MGMSKTPSSPSRGQVVRLWGRLVHLVCRDGNLKGPLEPLTCFFVHYQKIMMKYCLQSTFESPGVRFCYLPCGLRTFRTFRLFSYVSDTTNPRLLYSLGYVWGAVSRLVGGHAAIVTPSTMPFTDGAFLLFNTLGHARRRPRGFYCARQYTSMSLHLVNYRPSQVRKSKSHQTGSQNKAMSRTSDKRRTVCRGAPDVEPAGHPSPRSIDRSPASIDRSSGSPTTTTPHKSCPPCRHFIQPAPQSIRSTGREERLQAGARVYGPPPTPLPALLRTCPEASHSPCTPREPSTSTFGGGGGGRGVAGVGERRGAASTLPKPYLPHRAGKPSPAHPGRRYRSISRLRHF